MVVMNDKNLSNESIVIETSGFPNGKDGVFWEWKATSKMDVIDSDDGLSYEQSPTSVVAHLLSVIKALEWTVKNLPSDSVRIVSCLEFVVRAVNGEIRVKQPHLIPLYKNAKRLLSKTKAVVEWLPKNKMTLRH